ncbi:TPA: hypothetical protein ACSU82_001349 [Streptococcus pneumoniae]
MILWSFDFVNDHAHAFFMDNVEWSHADSYFLSFVSDDVEERYQNNIQIMMVLTMKNGKIEISLCRLSISIDFLQN